MLALHAAVPIKPAGRLELICGAAMARELRYVHGMAGAGQALRDVAQLHRCAAEAVDQQETEPSSGQANALIRRVHTLRPHHRWLPTACAGSSARFPARRAPQLSPVGATMACWRRLTAVEPLLQT